jgi:hypothetical protein
VGCFCRRGAERKQPEALTISPGEPGGGLGSKEGNDIGEVRRLIDGPSDVSASRRFFCFKAAFVVSGWALGKKKRKASELFAFGGGMDCV